MVLFSFTFVGGALYKPIWQDIPTSFREGHLWPLGGQRTTEAGCNHRLWERLIILDLFNTPWKINMEPTNHPFRKENDLPNLHDYGPC